MEQDKKTKIPKKVSTQTMTNSYSPNTTQPDKQSNWLKITLVVVGILFLVFIVAPILLFIAIGALVAISGADTSSSSTGNVAHIQINGMILTQTQASLFGGTSDTSSTELVQRLTQIQNDKNIKGVIFEINSPGGSGVASDEIAQAIAKLDKPTVSYVREVGASGAYWVASATDRIYVNRLSTVGSIGVIASYLEFSGFLDRYNITYQRFVAGENKDFGSPFSEVTPQQRAYFENLLDELHEIFIAEVAQGRGMTVEEIRPLADGSIFTGNRAVQIGLADEIGGKEQAIEYMEQVLGSDIKLVTYTRRQSFFDVLAGYTTKNSYAIGVGIGDSLNNAQQKLLSNTIRT